MILSASPQNITRASREIRAGRLVAFPTETVYGLGADATNSDAVEKIYTVKGRRRGNPLIVHVESFSALLTYADSSLGDRTWAQLHRLEPLWPGPLTVVVPRKGALSPVVSAGLASIALRVPSHPVALELIRLAKTPIAAPSANRSLYISPTRAEHVEECLGAASDFLVLDDGASTLGLESTVLSLMDKTPQVLRSGFITTENLEEILGEQVFVPSKHPQSAEVRQAPSPGMSPVHYSPNTPLCFLDEAPTGIESRRVGYLLFQPRPKLTDSPQKVQVLSETGDLHEVAANLYRGLRQLDKCQLDMILCDRCETHGLGLAIMDRLQRAQGRK